MACTFKYKGNTYSEDEIKAVLKEELSQAKPNPISFNKSIKKPIMKSELSIEERLGIDNNNNPINDKFYADFVAKANSTQKDTYSALKRAAGSMWLEPKSHTYYLGKGPLADKYTSVHDYLNKKYPNDAFDGDQSAYEINREYGHQVDAMLSYIVNNPKISLEGLKNHVS